MKIDKQNGHWCRSTLRAKALAGMRSPLKRAGGSFSVTMRLYAPHALVEHDQDFGWPGAGYAAGR
jgi:hypothetical protein